MQYMMGYILDLFEISMEEQFELFFIQKNKFFFYCVAHEFYTLLILIKPFYQIDFLVDFLFQKARDLFLFFIHKKVHIYISWSN